MTYAPGFHPPEVLRLGYQAGIYDELIVDNFADGFYAIEEICALEGWQWLAGRIFKGVARENEIPLGRIERLEMLKEIAKDD